MKNTNHQSIVRDQYPLKKSILRLLLASCAALLFVMPNGTASSAPFTFLRLQQQEPSSTPDSTELTEPTIVLSEKQIKKTTAELTRLADRMAKKQQATIAAMEQAEHRLINATIAPSDSSKAAQLHESITERYARLKAHLNQPVGSYPLKNYLSRIDSLQVGSGLMSQTGIGQVRQLTAWSQLGDEATLLQQRFAQAQQVQSFMQERQAQWKQTLQGMQQLQQIKQLQKEVYYYQAQVQAYKTLLKDPKALGGRLLQKIGKHPKFKAWLAKHSLLKKLFKNPAADPAAVPAYLASVQTNASIQQQLAQRFAPVGSNTTMPATGNLSGMTATVPNGLNTLPATVQQGLQNAQQQLRQQQQQPFNNQLQQLAGKLPSRSGSGGTMGASDMPHFTPNHQKTKTFWQRLDYGLQLQSQRSGGWLPATTDIHLQIGYKLHDKLITGIGAMYKLGWGQPIRNIQITHEGVGWKWYVEAQIKGQWWLAGGYEQMYLQRFEGLRAIHNINSWQERGLMGLSRKFKFGKKEQSVQVLWDFLSYRQRPQGTAILFRYQYAL